MKTMFVLSSVEDFAAGAFENTAVDDGGIQLGRRGTGYLAEGSYTSQPLACSLFRALIPSWNADTPPGTSIELQVRVQANGEWSRWFGFGHWSSFQYRSSPEPQQDALACVHSEWLRILPQAHSANAAQIRVHLHTQVEKKTPTIFLMALSVLADETPAEKERARERVLALPSYSSLVRDPSIAAQMGDVTSLTMLMNRWGTDLLPEEVARGTYDTGTHSYSNLAFLSSVGGIYGFESYVGFGGLDVLRKEIWQGHAVGAQVCYRKNVQDAQTDKPTHTDSRPFYPSAVQNSSGHLLVVRGFFEKDGEEYVAVNDPLASGNPEVAQEIALPLFRQMYRGLFLAVHRNQNEFVGYRPQRELVQLQIHNDEIEVSKNDEMLIPGQFSTQDRDSSTLCFTLSSSVAYASAAQRPFYYLQADEEGHVRFDRSAAEGKRMTFYRIGPGGYTWVGEKRIEATKEEKEEHDDNRAN